MATDRENGSLRVEGGVEIEGRSQRLQLNSTGPDPEYQLESPFYRSDEFRMYIFKIARCNKKYSHDWTQCPFAHPGEKAKRRDPQQYKYAAIACIDMKKNGTCPRGDSCPYAHNVFEYWMHPTRYRTQICNDGGQCNRSVCFFAHSLDELRVPPHKPGFPPEWRNRRHGRSNSMGSTNSPVASKNSARGQGPLSRTLSNPLSLPSDRFGSYKMQMSDGTWSSPGHHVPKVRTGSCPTASDLLGCSPGSGISPHVLGNQGVGSPFSRASRFPLSARTTRSFDENYVPRQSSSEDVAGMLLQLIDTLSLAGQQPALPSRLVPSSLDLNQIRALQVAAVEKALSARSSTAETTPGWSSANSCDDGPLTGRSGSLGDSGAVGRQSSGQFAPFPMMSREVEGPMLDRLTEDGSPQRDSLTVPVTCGLPSQVGSVSM